MDYRHAIPLFLGVFFLLFLSGCSPKPFEAFTTINEIREVETDSPITTISQLGLIKDPSGVVTYSCDPPCERGPGQPLLAVSDVCIVDLNPDASQSVSIQLFVGDRLVGQSKEPVSAPLGDQSAWWYCMELVGNINQEDSDAPVGKILIQLSEESDDGEVVPGPILPFSHTSVIRLK